MKKKIIDFSKKIGIELIGFTGFTCDRLLESKYYLQDKLKYKCSFQVGNITDKLLTSDKYKEYNTAIVIGMSYPKIESDKVHLSSCSWGADYHIVLKEKLELIGKLLVENRYKYISFVDNNPLDERYLAYKAGLGFFGKNNLLINEKYGSYFFIGEILTDLICEYDDPIKKKCISCNKCVKICPTKAINEYGILNQNKCLSYLTQKRSLTEEESKYINKCIYGCDICAKVCPHNENVESNNFKPLGNEIINETEFLNMTKSEFNEKYKHNSCFWKGKSVLDRNIRLMKNNLNK